MSFPRKRESRVFNPSLVRAPAAGAQRCEHRQRGRALSAGQAARKCRSASNTMPFTDKMSVMLVRGLTGPDRLEMSNGQLHNAVQSQDETRPGSRP